MMTFIATRGSVIGMALVSAAHHEVRVPRQSWETAFADLGLGLFRRCSRYSTPPRLPRVVDLANTDP
jgi:hypothetical protein